MVVMIEDIWKFLILFLPVFFFKLHFPCTRYLFLWRNFQRYNGEYTFLPGEKIKDILAKS